MKKLMNWTDLCIEKIRQCEVNNTMPISKNILDLPLQESKTVLGDAAYEVLKYVGATDNVYIVVEVQENDTTLEDLEIAYDLLCGIFTKLLVDYDTPRDREKRLGTFGMPQELRLKNIYAVDWANYENKCRAFGFEVKKKGGAYAKRLIK